MKRIPRILVGTRKGLLTFKPTGRKAEPWVLETVDFLGDPVTAVLPADGSRPMLAALNLGHFGVKLRRRLKKGWEEVASPAYPAAAKKGAAKKSPEAASLVQIWAMERGGHSSDEVWAGTIPGGLFHSADAGKTWTLNRSLWDRPERLKWMGGGYDKPGLHSICVHPRNAKIITIAVSTGGIWQTQDGGKKWELLGKGLRAAYMPPKQAYDPAVQDVHRLVQSPTDPETFWLQHHNGIFVSRDGARTWSEIVNVKPSVFGFGVAVHPTKPGTAWFAPAVKDECRVPTDRCVVVTRTRDFGKSFRALGRGLPAKNAFHLIYRHCLEVDESGEILVMGSTTGGLWVSQDQGDHWHCLSNDLPPIYCLRFAE